MSTDRITEGLIDRLWLWTFWSGTVFYLLILEFLPWDNVEHSVNWPWCQTDQRGWNIYSFPSCVSINEMGRLNGENQGPAGWNHNWQPNTWTGSKSWCLKRGQFTEQIPPPRAMPGRVVLARSSKPFTCTNNLYFQSLEDNCFLQKCFYLKSKSLKNSLFLTAIVVASLYHIFCKCWITRDGPNLLFLFKFIWENGLLLKVKKYPQWNKGHLWSSSVENSQLKLVWGVPNTSQGQLKSKDWFPFIHKI